MSLLERRKQLEKLRLQFSIEKLEVALLELDEQKIKINESIKNQKEELKELEGGNE